MDEVCRGCRGEQCKSLEETCRGFRGEQWIRFAGGVEVSSEQDVQEVQWTNYSEVSRVLCS